LIPTTLCKLKKIKNYPTFFFEASREGWNISVRIEVADGGYKLGYPG
jgi:hypothetical protein